MRLFVLYGGLAWQQGSFAMTTQVQKTGSSNSAVGTSVTDLFKRIRQNLPMTNKAKFEEETGLYLKQSVDPALKLDRRMTLSLLAKHDALLADGIPVTVDTLLDASGQRFPWLREDIKLVHATKVHFKASVISSPLPKGQSRAAIVEEWFPKLLARILEQEYLGQGKPVVPKYTFTPDGTESGTAGSFHDPKIMDAYFARFPKPVQAPQIEAPKS
jgi:hypothetical protein